MHNSSAPSRNSRVYTQSRQSSAEPSAPPSPTPRAADSRNSVGSFLPASSSGGSQPTVTQLSAWKGGVGAKPTGAQLNKTGLGILDMTRDLVPSQPAEVQTDNWDDDFEEGISLTKIQGKSA